MDYVPSTNPIQRWSLVFISVIRVYWGTMSGDTTLILGAGFSRPAGGPLLRDLLSKDVWARSDADPTSLEVLSNLVKGRDGPGENGTITLEDAFTNLWREARTAGRIRMGEERYSATELLSQMIIHLASVCGEVRVRRSTNLWTIYMAFFHHFFEESRSLTLITFNYDLLAEQILDDLGLRYDYGSTEMIEFDNSRRRRRLRRSGSELSLLKLHGSANWGVCRGCPEAGKYVDKVTAFERPYVPIRRKSCPWCGGKFLETAIVPPILGKAGEGRHVGPIWRLARRSLERAREVVVVGYSLPSSDVEAISLLREVDAPGKRPRITIVCGPRGAPPGYKNVFSGFKDAGEYFEDFALRLLD